MVNKMQTQDAPRLFDHLCLRSDGNMKQDTVTDKCIIDHHVKHKLSQVLINLTQDTRPRANSPGKKRKGTDRKRLEVATRKGTAFPCEPGVLLGRLGMLSSQIASSFAISHPLLLFLASFYLVSFSLLCCYLLLLSLPRMLSSLPFFVSFLGCVP